MTKHWEILVADDEEVMRDSLSGWLREDGYRVDTVPSGADAIAMARRKDYAIYFIDLKMPPGIGGIETTAEIRRIRPEGAIVIITAYATVDTAVAAMKEGAQEYIVKPCNPQEISLLVQRIIKVKNLQRENLILRRRLTRQYAIGDIISKNPRMMEIFSMIREIADMRSTVLVLGESGTGKEMVARAVHNSGSRSSGPFVAVSCAALAETLLESELFGHEKGSFTGATARKKGKFELADGGSIFLDEIGDITSKLQQDLLRVLQERCFYRVGGTEEIHVDARVIAATKIDLAAAVQEGRFRDDLFYRLNVITIRVPPLRERLEDVPLLASHFIERLSAELGREVSGITEQGLKALMHHSWPGNVRELENAIERAIVTCRKHMLSGEDFSFLEKETPRPTWDVPHNMTLREIEDRVMEETLRRHGGNIKETAAALGVDRSTLYDRLKRHRIERR